MALHPPLPVTVLRAQPLTQTSLPATPPPQPAWPRRPGWTLTTPLPMVPLLTRPPQPTALIPELTTRLLALDVTTSSTRLRAFTPRAWPTRRILESTRITATTAPPRALFLTPRALFLTLRALFPTLRAPFLTPALSTTPALATTQAQDLTPRTWPTRPILESTRITAVSAE